jgi:DNA repair exonuclease SbcCD ATPase subunit
MTDTMCKIGIYENKLNIKIEEINHYMLKYDMYHKLDEEVKVYEKYIVMMSDKGIKRKIMNNYEEIINKHMNKYIKEYFDFAVKLQLKDDLDNHAIKTILNIEKKDSVRTLSASSASGYEQFIINMAFKQALCDLTEYKKMDIYMQDEGFGVIDDKKIENIDIFFEYFRKNNTYTIIASHVEKVKQNYDHEIHIYKEDDVSKMKIL